MRVKSKEYVKGTTGKKIETYIPEVKTEKVIIKEEEIYINTEDYFTKSTNIIYNNVFNKGSSVDYFVIYWLFCCCKGF